MSKIEIRQVGKKPSIFTEILIDGHKIDGVRRFELKQNAGDSTPILAIDLNAFDLSTDLAALHVNQEGIGEIEEIKFRGMNEPIKFQ